MRSRYFGIKQSKWRLKEGFPILSFPRRYLQDNNVQRGAIVSDRNSRRCEEPTRKRWDRCEPEKITTFHFFLCNLLFASLFIHALWVSTSGILQTSLDIHPKPKISFCDYLLDHNLIWVWIIISTESKESRAPYKEKFWETRLPGDTLMPNRIATWLWVCFALAWFT